MVNATQLIRHDAAFTYTSGFKLNSGHLFLWYSTEKFPPVALKENIRNNLPAQVGKSKQRLLKSLLQAVKQSILINSSLLNSDFNVKVIHPIQKKRELDIK